MTIRLQKAARGFTLIELLVVIAIIGILSSVVLASLNTARYKGNYASAVSQLEELRNAAEISTDAAGNYPADVSPGVLPAGFAIGQWPTPPCGGWTYDWENWNSNTVQRITLRRTNQTSVFYICVADSTGGNCSNGGDGVDITTYAPKTITCNE